MGVIDGFPMTCPPGATRALLTDVPPTSRAMTLVRLGIGVACEEIAICAKWLFLKAA